jgi:hypothetical protein
MPTVESMPVLDRLHPIVVAWQGGLWQGSVVEAARYQHTFGGPLELLVRGFPKNRRPLHRLLTLDLRDPRFGVSLADMHRLPLLYGFAYDACVLVYQIVSDAEVRVIDLTPTTPSKDWPYKNYPDHFPAEPVAFGRRRRINRKALTELTWQGLDDEANEQLVVVVRPSDQFGVSLWGESGDAEEVEVVFCVRPESGRISVSNQCT